MAFALSGDINGAHKKKHKKLHALRLKTIWYAQSHG